MNWQPIATAPEWEWVLITDGKSVEVGRRSSDGYWSAQGGLDFDYGRWDEELTHWMPLPELPK